MWEVQASDTNLFTVYVELYGLTTNRGSGYQKSQGCKLQPPTQGKLKQQRRSKTYVLKTMISIGPELGWGSDQVGFAGWDTKDILQLWQATFHIPCVYAIFTCPI